MSKLAILGGEKAVKIPAPHFVWPIIGEDEKQAVMRQLDTGNMQDIRLQHCLCIKYMIKIQRI